MCYNISSELIIIVSLVIVLCVIVIIILPYLDISLSQPPTSKTADKMTQSETIQWPAMKSLIQKCIFHESQVRPSAFQVLTDLLHVTLNYYYRTRTSVLNIEGVLTGRFHIIT